MKNLQQELKKVAKDFVQLAGKLEKISQALEKAGSAPPKKSSTKKPPAKKKPAKVEPKKGTAFSDVIKIVNRSKKGITTSQIMERTGFNRVKVANIIFAAKKRGKIKTIGKGLYMKA
ncbi:hypothetical protein ACFL9U_01075 [Thermodesulfobacteriota bacterium]